MSDDKARLREERHAMFDRIYAFYDVRVLGAALETRLFEHTAAGPKTLDELVKLTGVPARVVRMLLVSLSAMKLMEFEGNGYKATDKAKRFFLKDGEQSMAHAVRMAEWQFDALTRMPDLVNKGDIIWNGFNHYLKKIEEDPNPELLRKRLDIFNEALAGSAVGTAKVVLANTDLSSSKHLLDIGGNLGVFSSLLLDKYPQLRATVFDLPQVVPQTREEFAKRGHKDRSDAVGGNFVTDAWPKGADLIAFIRIFAVRSREEVLELLGKAYDALPSGGKVLFYEEHVLPADPNAVPPGAAWAAVFFAMGSHGELRRVDEWVQLMAEAGFKDMVPKLGNPWGLVVGTKP